MESSRTPLLTIAIPTWNRASYLATNLAQLRLEMRGVPAGVVEVLVSDNCSPDETPSVVDDAIKSGLPVRYVRNERNLGWALNFVQCFELARGKYVLLLGDDDLFVDGALATLLAQLSSGDYGVVCLRPFGFDVDFRTERPQSSGRRRGFRDGNQFLRAISRWFTLTSALVINKSYLAAVDTKQFVDTNLAVFHLVLRAALAADRNLFVDEFLIASKRQNSFSYDYAQVFVGELWRIIDAHVAWGLKPETVRALEREKMLCYYPFYLLDLRLSGRGDLNATRQRFAEHFGERWLFRLWLLPIIRLPYPLAVAWGGVATVAGRVIGGDLRRGVSFALNRLRRMLPGWAARQANGPASDLTEEQVRS